MGRTRYQRKLNVKHELAFIVNKKLENKIYKLGKVDDRIPVLQLARSRGKKQKENDRCIEKDGFKPSSRLD